MKEQQESSNPRTYKTSLSFLILSFAFPGGLRPGRRRGLRRLLRRFLLQRFGVPLAALLGGQAVVLDLAAFSGGACLSSLTIAISLIAASHC
uniref:Uncharacterized protein n=1 Tax=Rhizophora mucronata TaxID=61149 RepID=A0A2P2NZW3_RHIMU